MPNQVLETEAFSRLFETLEKREKNWIKKVVQQLKENFLVGKPLKFNWFREKKFGGKRLYYLVYKKSEWILLVAFGTKKEQQKIINHILQNKEKYIKFVKQI